MLTYTQVTPEQFANLQASLTSRGVKAMGNAGEIIKFGAAANYCYSPATETLTVDVQRAPWMVSLLSFTQTIDSQIKSALQQTKEAR